MRRLAILVVAVLLSGTVGIAYPTVSVGAATNGWPRTAVTCLFFMNGGMKFGCFPVFANGEILFNAAGVDRLMLHAPIVGADGSGSGWLVAADGGVFGFGNARFYGSMGGKHLNAPIVGIASTGSGYWLVGRDGGIFSFGNARFYGSMGGKHLNQPIVAMAASRHGYWMVARDGGVFSLGDARYLGSMPSRGVHVTDVVSIAPTYSGKGYWIARADGHVYRFGNAKDFGNYPAPPENPVTAIKSTMSGPTSAPGYCLVLQSGAVLPFGLSSWACGE